VKCLCGDPATFGYEPADGECLFFELGYEWCPKCEDHHRPPVCAPVIQGEGLISWPDRSVMTYDVVLPEWRGPSAEYWTPFRDRLPRASKCYSLASGAMVHVKPECRC